jgi:general stress protein 26
MKRDELVWFLRRNRLAVQASAAPDGSPQAAVVGFAVSDDLEIVFDTVETTRKSLNLRADPRIALVIGWDDAVTVQIEGLADFPVGAELARLQECYFRVYPDGRDRLSWPGITYVRVRPAWVRYSDFTQEPPHVVEVSAAQLG